MKILLYFLLIIGCDKIKKFSDNLEIEDSYPVSTPYQLAGRQGKLNSLSATFNLKTFNKNKSTKVIKKIESESCDVFSVALDYISQRYPVKSIDTNDKIVITEDFKNQDGIQPQITIIAKNLQTLKVISNLNKNLAITIKNDIILECGQS